MRMIGQLHAPAALPLQEEVTPLNRRMFGPQSQSGRITEEKVLLLFRESNHDSSSIQPVDTPAIRDAMRSL
jgi:hypothetical protein